MFIYGGRFSCSTPDNIGGLSNEHMIPYSLPTNLVSRGPGQGYDPFLMWLWVWIALLPITNLLAVLWQGFVVRNQAHLGWHLALAGFLAVPQLVPFLYFTIEDPWVGALILVEVGAIGLAGIHWLVRLNAFRTIFPRKPRSQITRVSGP